MNTITGMLSGIFASIGSNKYATDPERINQNDVFATESQVSPQPLVMVAATVAVLIVVLIVTRKK